MRVHLDPIGGIAGDMFIAAILDAKPEWYDEMCAAIRIAGLPKEVGLSLLPHSDFALTGKRFNVDELGVHEHHHTSFSYIRSALSASDLDPQVRQIAIDIFCLLAEAESAVHGKPVETISFHEVGEWDSIADIVGAAFLIDKLSASWTLSALPLGRGTVDTSHGILPVPTPATVKLLEGFYFDDDGLDGERITPTGAAILAYLKPRQSGAGQAGKLIASGTGFGTKVFSKKSNVLRALMISAAGQENSSQNVIYQIDFDVDDQSAEDLAIGLDHIRSIPTVLDVTQAVTFGKKGRMAITIRVLAETTQIDQVFDACFFETTTIGLRYQILSRVTLDRWKKNCVTEMLEAECKFVIRPGATTVKVEADALVDIQGHANREGIRREMAIKYGVTGD
ncbi:MAG: LarC family nickel insertion protein [Proteobacteria bacterium]|nr:LarC family nickel insertion protein [Pseudomonadota bacterium]